MSRGPRPYGRGTRDEELAIAAMRRLRASGESLRGIASVLQRMGLRPPRGDRWHAATVKRILDREEGRGRQP